MSGRVPTFGELLSGHRASARLTQEELAARAGLSVNAVSLLERGERRAPRSQTVLHLARALSLSQVEREALQAAARRKPGAGASPLVVPPELRLPTLGMVGREREVARARELLARPDLRLLTLTGSPGSGKTRLALELAGELVAVFRDGVVLVALGPLRDPALVMPALRQALGLRETGDQPALESVALHCLGREMLLVLDNFEHLLAGVPELVELLRRCSGLRALVTSRAALRVRVEHELPVPPLALPSAEQERSGTPEALAGVASVRLFVERAEAVLPDFRLTAGNAAALAAICRRLDGLPLALELAAPWLRLLSPGQLLGRLDRRLELLVQGPGDLPERQRTLRSALAWSCELLDEGSRTLLRRLAVFAGSAPLDALEDVCQAPGALPGGVLRHLAVLLDHSLVQPSAAGTAPRVTMLESVREYAGELLIAAAEAEAIARAHLDFYSRLAQRARADIRGRSQESTLERLRCERDNMRAALGWSLQAGDAQAGLLLASGLVLYWDYDGLCQEGLRWLERLLALDCSVDPAVRSEALHCAGLKACSIGSYDLAIARHEEAVRIFRDLDCQIAVADALRGIGQAVASKGRYGDAIPLFEEAVSVLRGLDDPTLLATALTPMGICVGRSGDSRRAAALFEEALEIKRCAGDELGAALCLVNLADRARMDGNLKVARCRLQEAVAIARRLDSPLHMATAHLGLAAVARDRGDVAGAGAQSRQALRLFARSREPVGASNCLRWLGWIAWTQRRPARAALLYGTADALCPLGMDGDPGGRALHRRVRAELRERLGEERFSALYERGGRRTLEESAAAEIEPLQAPGR
jgi:predicted ATPase/DNA-binding XRE family transcriptional regulator